MTTRPEGSKFYQFYQQAHADPSYYLTRRRPSLVMPIAVAVFVGLIVVADVACAFWLLSIRSGTVDAIEGASRYRLDGTSVQLTVEGNLNWDVWSEGGAEIACYIAGPQGYVPLKGTSLRDERTIGGFVVVAQFHTETDGEFTMSCIGKDPNAVFVLTPPSVHVATFFFLLLPLAFVAVLPAQFRYQRNRMRVWDEYWAREKAMGTTASPAEHYSVAAIMTYQGNPSNDQDTCGSQESSPEALYPIPPVTPGGGVGIPWTPGDAHIAGGSYSLGMRPTDQGGTDVQRGAQGHRQTADSDSSRTVPPAPPT